MSDAIENFVYVPPAGFVDPASCDHEHTDPVYAYLRGPVVQVGDTVQIANGGRPVARICVNCSSALSAGWGCADCEWQTVELRRLCEIVPTVEHVLVRPCKEHA